MPTTRCDVTSPSDDDDEPTVRVLGLVVGRPLPARVAVWRDAEPTYAHVGSTVGPDSGDREAHEIRGAVGSGGARFTAAVEALRKWAPQRSVGATISPPGVQPTAGATVVLGLGVGPFRLLVPNRVVRTIDEPRRWGYAYGTLPGHPETGEELFIVEHHADETVTLTIRVDARPADALARLGPAVRAVQNLALRRYVTAVERA